MNMIQLFPHSPTNIDAVDPTTDSAGESAIGAPSNPTVEDVMETVGGENRPGTTKRPWLFTNMVASADGGTAVGGLSGALGGDGDMAMFRALRAQADVILVGAGTARAEEYRPPIGYSDAVDQRRSREQRPRPRLALISNRLSIEPDLPLFDESDDNRPLIITSEKSLADKSGRSDLQWLFDKATVLAAGHDQVDLDSAVELLGTRGHARILCEGGPSINGQLAAIGRVDEWNLTIAPLLAAGDSKRAAVGPLPEGPPPNMTLARVWLQDNYLFCRWVSNP